MKYQRILVPVDFSEHSLSAYQSVLDNHASKDSTLILLHVVEPGSDIGHGGPVGGDPVVERRRQLQTLANSRQDLWKEVIHLIESGKPTDRIIATAEQERADLVVMGAHGKGNYAKTLFGSTTYDVARKLACSVLISRST